MAVHICLRSAVRQEIPHGVYTLADIRRYGEEKGYCPYFVARHTITLANVVVYNYGAWAKDSNLGHQLLLPPADWCPKFAFRAT